MYKYGKEGVKEVFSTIFGSALAYFVNPIVGLVSSYASYKVSDAVIENKKKMKLLGK